MRKVAAITMCVTLAILIVDEAAIAAAKNSGSSSALAEIVTVSRLPSE